MFGKVDMETFKHLRIVVVSCPKVFNRFDVVEQRMKFRNVEVFSDKSCDEITTVSMKSIQRIFQIAKSN